MGTRSRVAVRNPDNTFTSIYVHFDGYPSGVGATLKEHYSTPELVAALIARGDMSGVEDTPEQCSAYKDRGETDVDAVTSPDLDSLKQLTQDTGGEWLYVFTGHGWQCAEGGIAFFGNPASEAPGDLESIEYWLAKERANGGA